MLTGKATTESAQAFDVFLKKTHFMLVLMQFFVR